MRGAGTSGEIAAWKSTAHCVSATASAPMTITSSPSVLITRASIGSECCDGLDEAFHDADGLLVAALLGQARIAGQVGEGDHHAHAPLLGDAAGELGLHVADHVLLDEVPEKAPVQVVA